MTFRNFAAICLGSVWLGAAAVAQTPPDGVAAVAAGLAVKLAAACPRAPVDDAAAHDACAAALRGMTDLPFGATIAWGGEQPGLRVAKKHLTNFHGEIFRALYLSLFWFDGTWSVTHDARDDVDVIAVGAFFRNRLPPGEFPYPFWHSADKWSDYERANRILFYVDPQGRIFAGLRSAGGDEPARGGIMVHQPPPAFDGNWQWTDAGGQLQPRVSLFASKYATANPFLPPLDAAYRRFATGMREGTCLRCHTPSNRADSDRLVLLQTPAHAAAALPEVLKAVRNGDMPQNDWGEKKEIDPQLRRILLEDGEAFARLLAQADLWEAGQRSGPSRP